MLFRSKEGLIQQIGRPTDIYNEPKNAYVADFIGESNILPGEMERDFSVSFAGRTFACVDRRFPDSQVDVVIRPEDIQVVPPSDTTVNGTVTSVVFKGVHYEMLVKTDGCEWLVQSTDRLDEGMNIGMTFDPDEIHIMRKSDFSPDRRSQAKDGPDKSIPGKSAGAGSAEQAAEGDW